MPICVLESRCRKIERGVDLDRIGEASLTPTDALHCSTVSAARKSVTMIFVSMRKSIPSAKQRGLRCINRVVAPNGFAPRALLRRSTALQNASLSKWREDCSVLLNRGAMPGSAQHDRGCDSDELLFDCGIAKHCFRSSVVLPARHRRFFAYACSRKSRIPVHHVPGTGP